jgi:hypothetical protein
LTQDKLIDWHKLVTLISNFRLQEGNDRFKWNLCRDGTFSVRSMYLHRLDSIAPYRNKAIWKLKIPLKIKIFLWLLNKRVILTKDNLARKNWKGSQRCCFCNNNETIQHLFFYCPHVRDIWRIVFYATDLSPPRSVSHMLGRWLSNQYHNIKKMILVGVGALCWAIWRCRSDMIFNKTKYNSFLQALFRGTYWLRFWSQLQLDDNTKEMFRKASSMLEVTALEQANHGWKHNNRLAPF